MTTTAEPRRGAVEIRSIDYVPLAERHGKLWHLGPLWFMSNAQIATLAVGVLGVGAGGNLIWSLIAILLGVVVGTFFMAAHCSQGPQLGLPQMIQSRPQFGYVGAILVWLFAYLQYAGFNVFNTLLASESVTSVTGGGIGQVRLWLVVGTALAAAAATKSLHYTASFSVITIGRVSPNSRSAATSSSTATVRRSMRTRAG